MADALVIDKIKQVLSCLFFKKSGHIPGRDTEMIRNHRDIDVTVTIICLYIFLNPDTKLGILLFGVICLFTVQA